MSYISNMVFMQTLKAILTDLSLIKYGEYQDKNGSRVLLPDELFRYRIGTCYDQALYTYVKLKKIFPKTEVSLFFILNFFPNLKEQQHRSHTGVIIKHPSRNTYHWVEHAWGDQKGIHTAENLKELHQTIKRLHRRSQQDYLINWNPSVNVNKLLNLGKNLTYKKFLDICLEGAQGVK